MSRANEFQSLERRTRLLISVRDEAEVEDAIVGGAEWIDFKEPHEGPLGAVAFDQACRMVETAGKRCPISAALGELTVWQDSPAQSLLNVPGIAVVKLGLAGCGSLNNWTTIWEGVFRQAAEKGKALCGVVYADWSIADAPRPGEVLDLAIRLGAEYLLIDTWDKKSQSSLQCLPSEELKQIIRHAKHAKLQTVLAGNLQAVDIPSAVKLGTDLLAVRSAACLGGRTESIDRASVRTIQVAISLAWNANEIVL